MQLLGGLEPARFLAEHWQKKPLLVRGAIPGFTDLLTPRELVVLTAKRDATARTVRPQVRKGVEHHVIEHGPFPHGSLKVDDKKRKTPWTVLLQGAECHVHGAWDLLARFSFLPHARIDDLMISYAEHGGGVGPHFDLYDVFLLQGGGQRRWRINTDRALTRGEGRALAPFSPTDEWVLGPGDMLYLPPRVAHWGVAEPTAMTYSIGLLAPTHEQITANFAAYLAQRPAPPAAALYADPDLAPQAHAGEITDATLARVTDILGVDEFWGRYLTGPKPHVEFARPRTDAPDLARVDVALAPQSRMLFRRDAVYLNGERFTPRALAVFRALADDRRVTLAQALPEPDAALVRAWHKRGFVRVSRTPGAPA